MTVRLEIEAPTYIELVNRVIETLHFPCNVGINVEIGPKAGAVVVPPEPAKPTDEPDGSDAPIAAEPIAVAETPRRKRRTKAEMEAARAVEADTTEPPLPLEEPTAPAAVSPTSIFDDEPAPAVTPSAPKITEDQLREKLQTLASKNGGAGLKDVLKVLESFGYSKVKGIKQEHYDAIAAKLDGLLKE